MEPLLLHGDCLELMKTLPNKSIDLFVCDLPYGCLAQQKGATPFGRNVKGPSNSGCDWDIKIDLGLFWEQVKRLAKDDHTPVLMFCSTKFGAELITSNPDWFRYDLVWNKMRGVSFLSANKMPMRSHEMIYVFSKKGANYYRKDMTGDFKRVGGGRDYKANTGLHGTIGSQTPTENTGKRCVLSVVDMGGSSKKGQHPTQKPDDLYEWLITRYSKEGDTILDPTAGSFASVFTAHRLNRKAIGMEMDDGFFAKAETYIKNLVEK